LKCLESKKLRILHVVPSYIPAYRYGGPIRSVHGLCKGLTKRGHEVHVFTTSVDGNRDSDVPLGVPVEMDGVRVWYFPSKYLRRLYYSPSMHNALNLKLKTCDMVHLHSIFLWPTWAAAQTARRFRIPYIVSPRGMLVKDLIKRKNRLIKLLWISLIERSNLENAAALHVTSKIEADEAACFGFRLPKIVTVPNGVDASLTPPSLPLNLRGGWGALSPLIIEILGKGPFLLFLGRINWKKGLDRLIPALSHIANIPLVIVGNDEENYTPELKRLANAHKVEDRIIFIGPVYGDDKAALLQQAAALVLPSYSENFGIVVLEAMAAGCPVVVTPEVGLSDTVRETGSGIVVQDKPAQIGNSINNLLSNPDLMRQMGKNGLRVVKERFTWEAVSGQMEQVYQDVLDEHIKR
jgi:glycosyltransferase involved in cell wall biosynthesis